MRKQLSVKLIATIYTDDNGNYLPVKFRIEHQDNKKPEQNFTQFNSNVEEFPQSLECFLADMVGNNNIAKTRQKEDGGLNN